MKEWEERLLISGTFGVSQRPFSGTSQPLENIKGGTILFWVFWA